MQEWIENNVVNIFAEICEAHIPVNGVMYDEHKKNVLMISHTLERGGAPLVLLELMKQYQKEYNVYLVSMCDGNLLEEMLCNNIPVFLCNPIQMSKLDRNFFADAFEQVWVNTLVSYSYLMFFQNTDVPVYWWLHEPEILFRGYYQVIPHMQMYSENIRILPVSRLVQQCVLKYYQIDTEVLHMPIDDVKCETEDDKSNTNEKVVFFMPAKFQSVKGQDVFAKAILEMSDAVRDKAYFIFAGAKDVNEPEYYELIESLEKAYPRNVQMLGEISKDQVYSIYEKCDCVVAPSRLDATPTTIIEAMMFGRVCICSDHTGISQYMQNGVDGYIVESENEFDLKEKLEYIIEHIGEMECIRANGRRLFLEHFETSKVWEKLGKIVNKN